jgi:branched-chain amino acid transport system ATP-binding protein
LAAEDTLFTLTDVHSGYGEIQVLKGVSFTVRRGEILAIIGANGAGKSTLLRTIFGTVRVSRGDIYYEGARVTNRSPFEILALGVAYVPQGRTNFPAMSIQENLEMGAFIRKDARQVRKDIDALCERFPILKRRTEKAGNLSGGQQQILEMAMALILHPKAILIDEPTLGLSPMMVSSVFEAIKEINAGGTTVLMVEQNAKRALEISDHAVVLDLGKKRFEGTGQEILNNPDVRRHYLGL